MANPTKSKKPKDVNEVLSQLHFNRDVIVMFEEVIMRLEALEKILAIPHTGGTPPASNQPLTIQA